MTIEIKYNKKTCMRVNLCWKFMRADENNDIIITTLITSNFHTGQVFQYIIY